MLRQTETPKKLRNLPLLRTAAAMAISVFLVAGCSGAGLKTHAQILSEDGERYIAANPDLSEKTKNDIRRHKLHEGMSKRDVIAAWGRPVIVRKYGNAEMEHWYFGCDFPHNCNYPDEDFEYPLVDEIYESQATFKDGKLVSWKG